MSTQVIPLPAGVWTEVTAPASMTDGTSYAVEVSGGPADALDVDGNGPPAADARGHRWYPGSESRPADYRAFEKVSGRTWWWRPAYGAAALLVSEI